jgi:hypothetical protein
MFVARWQFTSRFGKLDDTLSILRKWEIDVGERVGWKSSSVRVLTGFIGGNDSEVEFEAHIDNLTDLEATWGDMERNPHHREYLKQLESVIVSGTSRWTILREVSLVHRQS